MSISKTGIKYMEQYTVMQQFIFRIVFSNVMDEKNMLSYSKV